MSSDDTNLPWVEKYRPKQVSDIVAQDEAVAVLNKCIQGADMQNLLFYGPPGTGKTSAAVALCHQLFRTPEAYKDRVLEMNASDERGIDVVRHRIKEFSRLAVSSAKSGKNAASLVALKVIILDEADAMTGPAQAALRRTMENESHTTRFFIICNYISRIIEPLTSRCAKFRFKPLSVDDQRERLTMICKEEGASFELAALDELVCISGGDLRKSITLLQSLACAGAEITCEAVREISGYVPDSEIHSLMKVARSGDLKQLVKSVKQINRQGYSAYQVINQLTDLIVSDRELKPDQKTKIFNKIGECEKRLLDGADEFLQLLDLTTLIQKMFFHVDEE